MPSYGRKRTIRKLNDPVNNSIRQSTNTMLHQEPMFSSPLRKQRGRKDDVAKSMIIESDFYSMKSKKNEKEVYSNRARIRNILVSINSRNSSENNGQSSRL
jgi:hypothetical protein